MNRENAHRIRALRWSVQVPSTDRAFALRNELRTHSESTVLAAIESVFDTVATADDVVHIPQLRLHIKVPLQNLNALLPELIAAELSAQLQSLRLPKNISDLAQHSPRDERHHDELSTLWFFLTTGLVPWQIANETTTVIIESLRNTARQYLPTLANRISAAVIDFAFCFRLLELLTEEQQRELLLRLFSESNAPIVFAIKLLVVQLSAGDVHGFARHTQKIVVAKLLALALKQEKAETIAPLLAIEQQFSAQEKMLWRDWIATQPEIALVMPQSSMSSPRVHGFANDHDHAIDEKIISPLSTVVSALALENNHDDASPMLSRNTSTNTELSRDLLPLAVQDAGLILLQPFIVPLFTNVGLLSTDNKTLAPHQLSRAAQLLFFLAHGDDIAEEFQLGFIKILLGLEPTQPLLLPREPLASGDRTEADALLAQIISHWYALKNTSRDGLRGTFLRRNGLLRCDDNGWRLQVERQAFDILLDYLPWSFRLTKLPWMKKAVHTEW